MRPQLKTVEPLKDYKLVLRYSNGECRIYDVSGLFNNSLNNALKSRTVFETVRIVGCGIEWSNGVDVCPDELYNNSTAVAT